MKQLTSRLLPALALVTFAILAASVGCGEGSDATALSTSSPSEAEYGDRVEAMVVAMEEALTSSEDLDPPTIERIEDLFAFPGRLVREAGYVSACTAT